jgi:hypothetical protein
MVAGRHAEDRLGHVRAPRADQPGHAQDLAPAQGKADILENAGQRQVLTSRMVSPIGQSTLGNMSVISRPTIIG